MPHISNSDKEMYEYRLGELSNVLEGAPVGHLTYVLYVLALRWMNVTMGIQPTFVQRALALAGLNEAQHELRRLYLAPYEDQKIEENGEAL